MMKNLFLLFLLIASNKLTAQTGYYITSLDSTKLYVQEFGSGEPIIILAGGPGLNAIYMKPVWENLSSKFRCIILDQRGTGKSILTTIDSSSVSLGNYVNDLEALRGYLKIDKLTLIGHSWGGGLSLEYAARHPNHVKRLILLGSRGPTKKFLGYLSDNFFMRLHDEDLREMAVLDSLKKDRMKGFWPAYFFDRKKALETKATTNFDELTGEYTKIRRFVDYSSTDDERIKLLKKFKGAVYIIQGRQDPIGESTVYELKELMPHSKVFFIEKCGHLPWLENPKQVTVFFTTLNDCLK